jgi:hypothetical protein
MGNRKPSIVYAFCAIGTIILASSSAALLVALSTFFSTVEGPPAAELIRDAAGIMSGLLLLAVAAVIGLLYRITVAVEHAKPLIP